MFLVITESPAKAKKIEGFLNDNYIVRSSCGHIRDLEKKKTKIYGDPKSFGIDIENNFKPKYVNIPGKKDIIQSLKKSAVDKEIIFAADDDREGEAIAWHTSVILKSNINNTNRIIFREISKEAILYSLKHPRKINMNEVNSQQARRIIDRLIGFKLSPCLWKNIQTTIKGLSAGRVQSALLNLVNERDQYIKKYKLDMITTIDGTLQECDKLCIYTELNYIETTSLFEKIKNNKTLNVIEINKESKKMYPDKPFITSSLQQSAQRNFGFTIKHTMLIAQSLYDNGHITYMRTDSTFISKDFQNKIKNMIHQDFNENYYNKPSLKKIKGAQEAHEAIRMTSLKKPNLFKDELKLYNLIYDRTIMCHLKPAEYIYHKIKLSNNIITKLGYFTLTYKQLIFPGFKIYNDNTLKKEKDPIIKKNYNIKKLSSNVKEGNKPQYYDESDIVNLLEKTGIGRPSTYSNIVGTLDNRNYTIKQDITEDDKIIKIIQLNEDNEIIKEEKKIKGRIQKKKIIITPLGLKVLNYLKEHFMNIIRKEFTCDIEKDLDKIALGQIDHNIIIKKVYDSFITIVERELTNKNHRINMNLIGKKDNKEIYIGDGKYGPYIQIKDLQGNIKNINITKYLELNQINQSDFTINDALNILQFPKKITNNIMIHFGPYGYYMKYNGINYSIKQMKNGTKLIKIVL